MKKKFKKPEKMDVYDLIRAFKRRGYSTARIAQAARLTGMREHHVPVVTITLLAKGASMAWRLDERNRIERALRRYWRGIINGQR